MHKKGKLLKKIITFVGSFLAALSVVAQFFPEAFSFLNKIPDLNRIVFICVIVMLLGLFFMNWKQSLDENEFKLITEHEATHRYAHLLRDTTYEIKKISEDKVNNAMLLHVLTTFSEGVVSCIYDTICSLLNADANKNELSVSIKILDIKDWDNSKIPDKSQAGYHTLCRSFTAKGALQADDAVSHTISENTSFYRIFVEGKHDWTGLNLSKKNNIEIISEDSIIKCFEYRDSCSSWNEYYSSRIVVPIRVKLSEIDDSYMNSDERNLYGFVCIEYKKSSLLKISGKFDEDLISMLNLLKTYADTMYVIYDSIYKTMSFSEE